LLASGFFTGIFCIDATLLTLPCDSVDFNESKPLFAARSTKLQIIFKEDWVVERYYTATVKLNFDGPIVLLGILEPFDPANKWLLRGIPENCLYEPFREGASAFSSSVKNAHLL
jgi:hypothetical protein